MKPKKILIANVPADGHFNPLTGIAMHLKAKGHDVRWYTQELYKEKIERMGIPYYPFVAAPQLNQNNFESYFTERANKKSQISKFRFDLEHCFIRRTMESFEDIKEIYKSFPFDLMIADVLSTVIPVVKEKLNVPVISVGVVPVMETSRDLAPNGLAITPSRNMIGRAKQSIMRFITDKIILSRPNKIFKSILREQGIEPPSGNVFDILYRSASLVLQSGTPGLEYNRSDLNKNIRFVGPLLPYTQNKRKPFRLSSYMLYENVVLVTQGTVEKNPEKILIPTLEAYKDTNTLVIATTGGNGTQDLKKRYPQANLVIEDFIPFHEVMPICDVYITNGGYGGVLLGIQNKLPMVVAGVHEGKNEICARVGYFKLGINLETETPTPKQISKAVEAIKANKVYKNNVTKLSKEFSQYDPKELCEEYIAQIFDEARSSVHSIHTHEVKRAV